MTPEQQAAGASQFNQWIRNNPNATIPQEILALIGQDKASNPNALNYVTVNGTLTDTASIQGQQALQTMLASGNYINLGTPENPELIPKGSAAAANLTNPSNPPAGGSPGSGSSQVSAQSTTTGPSGGGDTGPVTGLLNGQLTTFVDAATAQQYGATNIQPAQGAGGGGTTGTPTTTDTSGSGQYHTGNASIDAILDQFYNMIQKNISNGQTVNPNITIDANTISQFIDQAHKEIDPYYSSLLGGIKDDLIANLQTNAQSYGKTIEQEAINFQKQIAGTQEAASGAGTAFSGGRGLQEQQDTQSEQNTLDLDALRASSSAAQAARTAESKIGTSNISGINLPGLPSYSALINNQGGGLVAGNTNPYFTPGGGSDGNVMGTDVAQQTSDVAQRVSALKSDYLTNRTYSGLTGGTA